MKKSLCFMLAIILMLALVGCNTKTKAAKEAEEAIAAIGEVTIESYEAISNAEKAYDILTEDEKETVDNRIDLVNAREKYENIVKEKQAQEEYAKINAALPEATKLIEALSDAADDLEFIAKYAGGTNNSGSMKFADSFTDNMTTRFDNIDMDIISAGIPELSDAASEIQTNYYNIESLLIDMGVRNSAENVSLMKQMSLDTIDMINDLIKEQMAYIESLKEEANID